MLKIFLWESLIFLALFSKKEALRHYKYASHLNLVDM